MLKKYIHIILSTITLAFSAFSYRFETSESYISGGLGLTTNVARFNQLSLETPKIQLPIIGSYDYFIDKNISAFGSVIPQFFADSIGISFKGGAKYWFLFDGPYVPYVSLALLSSFLFPTDEKKNHYNLGLSPGVGMNYFVLAHFLVGAHIHFNPSIAFASSEKKFEFSVTTFFDVMLRL